MPASDAYIFRLPETADWHTSAESDDFDYVGVAERADGHRIHLYRNPQKTGWHNLDAQGRHYQFAGADPHDRSLGRFVRTIDTPTWCQTCRGGVA